LLLATNAGKWWVVDDSRGERKRGSTAARTVVTLTKDRRAPALIARERELSKTEHANNNTRRFASFPVCAGCLSTTAQEKLATGIVSFDFQPPFGQRRPIMTFAEVKLSVAENHPNLKEDSTANTMHKVLCISEQFGDNLLRVQTAAISAQGEHAEQARRNLSLLETRLVQFQGDTPALDASCCLLLGLVRKCLELDNPATEPDDQDS
jgi:hypothetical protein